MAGKNIKNALLIWNSEIFSIGILFYKANISLRNKTQLI
jgi:hypothetical protein